MGRLYVNQTLEKQIRQYCELNEIEDINAFANRCLSQGFNIVKFGVSPSDNKERENNGIKDFNKNEGRKKKESPREDKGEQKENSGKGLETHEEESKPIEERKQTVTVRKIQIIKKND
jgi:hypothetical protein